MTTLKEVVHTYHIPCRDPLCLKIPNAPGREWSDEMDTDHKTQMRSAIKALEEALVTLLVALSFPGGRRPSVTTSLNESTILLALSDEDHWYFLFSGAVMRHTIAPGSMIVSETGSYASWADGLRGFVRHLHSVLEKDRRVACISLDVLENTTIQSSS